MNEGCGVQPVGGCGAAGGTGMNKGAFRNCRVFGVPDLFIVSMRNRFCQNENDFYPWCRQRQAAGYCHIIVLMRLYK